MAKKVKIATAHDVLKKTKKIIRRHEDYYTVIKSKDNYSKVVKAMHTYADQYLNKVIVDLGLQLKESVSDDVKDALKVALTNVEGMIQSRL